MRTVRVLVAVVLAASFVMLSPATASAATSCADLSFLTTEQKTAFGMFEGQCITKSVGQTDQAAVQAWALTPGEIREMKVSPGGTALVSTAATVAATVAPQWGKIAGLIGTGLTAVATAGVTLFGGGIGNWWWQPDAPAVEQIPGGTPVGLPISSASNGPGVTAANATTRTSPYPYGVNFQLLGHSGSAVQGQVWYVDTSLYPTSSLPSAQTLLACANSGTNTWPRSLTTMLSKVGGCGGVPTQNVYGSGVGFPMAGSGSTWSTYVTGQYATATQRPAYALLDFDGTASSFAQATTFVVRFDYGEITSPTGASAPGSALAGRTIEQTISCKRPNGTTYTYTNTADASAAITPGSLVPVAGLMCDTGDRAESATATVKSPSKPDVQIISPTAVPSRNPVTNSTTWVTNETVTVVGDPDGVVTTLPGPGPVTEPTTPTGSCSLGWGDVLNGSILFDAVSCALSWAFVPSAAATVTATSTVTSAWNASGVGQLLTSVKNSAGVVWGTFTQSTGCGGIAFTVPFDGMDFQTEVLDSCVEPTKTMADWSRNILTVVIVLGGGLMVINTFLGAFGWPQLFRRGSDDS